MSRSDLSRIYGAGSFLNLLPERERDRLQAAATRRAFPQGAPLARQGELANNVILIDGGWALETAFADNGTETVLRVFGPGDIVGDYSALTGGNRESTVASLHYVLAMILPAERFTALLESAPAISRVLFRVLEQRLHEADHRIRVQAAYAGSQRLAGLLLGMADRYGTAAPGGSMELDLPLAQHQLASMAGVSRETVVRALAQWRRRGLIRTARREIELLDVTTLRRIAADPVPTPAKLLPDASRLRTERSIDTVIAAIDIVRSGRLRDETAQHVRVSLFEILQRAFSDSGISLGHCHIEDRGDGLLVVAPPAAPAETFIDTLTGCLPAELHRHNKLAIGSARIRLRIATHAGFVHFDVNGMTGRAIVHLFRLLDAPVFRDALRDSSASLGIIMSDRSHAMMTERSRRFAQETTYRPIHAATKAGPSRSWMYLPPPSRLTS